MLSYGLVDYIRCKEGGYVGVARQVGESEPKNKQDDEENCAYGNPYACAVAAVGFRARHGGKML